MRRFKWIEWNLGKIDAHNLSRWEVEATFDRAGRTEARLDGSFETVACTQSGRTIIIIWRYDTEDDEIPDVFGDPLGPSVFVITAY